ncbi:MAG: hypothetical protein ACRD21_01045 [Vicinamibacteria bacterium]
MERDPRRKGRFFPGLVVGFFFGALAVALAPSWWRSQVPDALFPGGSMEGVVLAKSGENGKLLLKLETGEGSLLATFTERVDEIDLLIEKGDRITLRVARYQPFLIDPRLARVSKAESFEEAPATATTTETTTTTTTTPPS